MASSASHTTLTTLTVKKGASTASLSLLRARNGDIYFTDTQGNRRLISGNEWATKLFEEINALV